MKVKITVGSVEIRTDGLEMTQRQITLLLAKAAAIAVAVDVTEAEEHKAPFGFSATLELDPERNVQPDLSEWFEESP